MAEELRPKPSGYKPSGRKFNMLEQTPEGLLFSHPGSAEYRQWYNRAAKLFDAEGHHVVDLAYIDQMLYNAGFTSGAHGTVDYSEARNRIIEKLRKQGVDLGNVRENIVPLSQQKTVKGVEKTGKAHKWVHDLYNMIPEDSPEKLRTLTEDQFVDYITDRARIRKQIVIDAMIHKMDALYKTYPKLKNAPIPTIESWIRKNKQIWGQLGDESFKQAVGIKLQQPEVPGQPRGRVPFPRSDVEELMLGTKKGFMAADPLMLATAGAADLIRRNVSGSLMGAGFALASPDVQQAVESGDAFTTVKEIGKDVLIGAGVEQLSKAVTTLMPQTAAKIAPVLSGAAALGPASFAATIGGSQDVKIQQQKFEQYASTLPPEQAATIRQQRQQSLEAQQKPLIDGDALLGTVKGFVNNITQGLEAFLPKSAPSSKPAQPAKPYIAPPTTDFTSKSSPAAYTTPGLNEFLKGI